MKVLVIGGGGREHALGWKLRQSPEIDKLCFAPGNAGTARLGDNIDLPADNVDGLVAFARREKIGFTVVGPEAPLVKGIVDRFDTEKLPVFGPVAAAAELEGSKVWCKNLLRKHGIPTAPFRVFTDAKSAVHFLKDAAYPLVVKADGLAAGKGAVVCPSAGEAIAAVEGMMEQKIFGKAGERVVVEEFLSGVEASILALTDGKTILPLETAQDHKRALDGDRGPNTGGMGAYSPADVVSPADLDAIIRDILVPTVHAMTREKRRYRGLLYAGIMLTKSGPRLIEYNVRFGDPECQPLMMRLKSDLLPLLRATAEGKLDEVKVEWDPRPSLCVVMASGGYPGPYETGAEIAGLAAAEEDADVAVFHAGTVLRGEKVVTSGGRVLGVTARGGTVQEAYRRGYAAVRKVSFANCHYRTDIGGQALGLTSAKR